MHGDVSNLLASCTVNEASQPPHGPPNKMQGASRANHASGTDTREPHTSTMAPSDPFVLAQPPLGSSGSPGSPGSFSGPPPANGRLGRQFFGKSSFRKLKGPSTPRRPLDTDYAVYNPAVLEARTPPKANWVQNPVPVLVKSSETIFAGVNGNSVARSPKTPELSESPASSPLGSGAFSPYTPKQTSGAASLPRLASPSSHYEAPMVLKQPGISRRSPSIETDSCSFCDLPLKQVFTSEVLVETKCGHPLHSDCYAQIVQNTVATTQPSLCGTCDMPCEPLRPADAANVVKTRGNNSIELGSGFVFEMGDTREPLSPSSLNSVLSNACNGSAVVGQAYQSCKVQTVSHRQVDYRSNPISLVARVTVDQVTSNEKARVRCLVGVSGPQNLAQIIGDLVDPDGGRHLALQAKEISDLVFKGRRLWDMNLGRLRVSCNLEVSANQANWKLSQCHVFENALVIARDQSVRATIDLRAHLKAVVVDEMSVSDVIKLELDNRTLPTISFRGSICDLVLLKAALCYPKLNLALTLDKDQDQDEANALPKSMLDEAVTVETAPLELLVCMPAASSNAEQASSYIAAIHRVRESLPYFCKLGVVVYSPAGLKSIPLTRVGASHWDSLLDTAFTGHSSFDGPFDLGSVLREASKLLEDHNVYETLAGVILLSSLEAAAPFQVPTSFVNARIPIHTVGIGRAHLSSDLTTISEQTGGKFTAVGDSSSLEPVVLGMAQKARDAVHKDVSLVVELAKGVQGFGSNKTSEIFEVGQLSLGETRTFMLSLEVDLRVLESDTLQNFDIITLTASFKGLHSTTWESNQLRTSLKIPLDELNTNTGQDQAKTRAPKHFEVEQRDLTLRTADILARTAQLVEAGRILEAKALASAVLSQIVVSDDHANSYGNSESGDGEQQRLFMSTLCVTIGDLIRLILMATFGTELQTRKVVNEIVEASWILAAERSFSDSSELGKIYGLRPVA